jgi:hypothetical protein
VANNRQLRKDKKMKRRSAPSGMRDAMRYWILHSLAAQPEGRAALSAVFRHVEQNLGPNFSPREKADVPSGGIETWKNDIQQERRNMIEKGYLVNRNDGIWEIAQAGRALLRRYNLPPIPGFNLDDIG